MLSLWRLSNSCCINEVASSAQTTRRLQESETLYRKGGTSRLDNAPHASGARVVAKLACGATLSATREFAMFAGSSARAMGARYLFRATITPQMCVIHLKSLVKIRQICRKLSNFSLRFAISGAYSSKFMGDHSTINAQAGARSLVHLCAD